MGIADLYKRYFMKTIVTIIAFFSCCFFGFSQITKKPLDHSVYDNWKTVTNEIISDDGKWVSYEINPQKGDGWLYLWNSTTNKLDSFPRGCKAIISPLSDFIIYRIKTPESVTRKAKKDKKKKEVLPKDSLAVYFMKKDTILKYERIKSFSVPKENPVWLAIYLEKEVKKAKKDTTSVSDTIKKKEKKSETKAKKPKEKKEPGTRLILLNTASLDTVSFPRITEYAIAKKGQIFSFIQTNKDTIDTAQVYIFNTRKKEKISIYNSPGIVKNICCSETGDAVTFLSTKDTCENKTFALNLWTENSKKTDVICDTNSFNIPKGWTPSEFATQWFSSDGTKLYFGTAKRPVNMPKDTLLDEEKYSLDIWNWNDGQLQSVQLKDLEKDKKKNFTAVFQVEKHNIVQLADTVFDQVSLPFKGNGKYVLASSNIDYEKSESWDFPSYHDYSITNLETGQRTEIVKKIKHNVFLSPSEKYLFWFDYKDSAWYVQQVNSEKSICLTHGLNIPFYNEFENQPTPPAAWGSAGWTNNDESFLAYDRYDIWKFDPTGKVSPIKITQGRNNKISYRFQKTDPEKNYIDKNEPLLFHTFNEINKGEGYCYFNLKKNSIEVMIDKLANVAFSVKAKNSKALLWTENTYNIYPNIHYSTENFKNPNVISNANPQQNQYLWGSVELVKWKAFDGKELEGLLYKPENFNPTKKYPMISYFYERNSDELFRHTTPRPSRSVINFAYYTSNGYLIFVPDVKYGIGHPGKDAYNCIISGIQEICKNSWVDLKHLGLQGQSWGGYQIAYLVTKTDSMFAAAMAGAPVSNMTSAYGGIRWESGQSRMSQYEDGQSRIGATLWDSLSLYIENSPLFAAPNVKTPLLIMSNDGDGAVPWYQGIEYFTALRRLGKPVWMLNYNGDEHNLSKRPNMVDLTIRMQQFFDHFLKNAKAPEWLEKGVPAIKKGIEKGYKLTN